MTSYMCFMVNTFSRPSTVLVVLPTIRDNLLAHLLLYSLLLFFVCVSITADGSHRYQSHLLEGGGGAARLSLFLSPFPCLADHERDWPTCNVDFVGLATNTLNVTNNSNNNSNCNVSILAVFTKNLPTSPRFSPYEFLSRCC